MGGGRLRAEERHCLRERGPRARGKLAEAAGGRDGSRPRRAARAIREEDQCLDPSEAEEHRLRWQEHASWKGGRHAWHVEHCAMLTCMICIWICACCRCMRCGGA